ncbi:hypothetical protein ACIBCM_08070 [Streptomyces sp. NPDC051018]|uniref:hypothetical protein n=1 Tax=Streptomyces sp. NPDC051018 TaxID=3365639 RepID=UPI0037BC9C4B
MRGTGSSGRRGRFGTGAFDESRAVGGVPPRPNTAPTVGNTTAPGTPAGGGGSGRTIIGRGGGDGPGADAGTSSGGSDAGAAGDTDATAGPGDPAPPVIAHPPRDAGATTADAATGQQTPGHPGHQGATPPADQRDAGPVGRSETHPGSADGHPAGWTAKGAAPTVAYPGKDVPGAAHPGGHFGSGTLSHPVTDGGFPPGIAHPHPLDPGKAPMNPQPAQHPGTSPYGEGSRPSDSASGGGNVADECFGQDDVPPDPMGGSDENAQAPAPPPGGGVTVGFESAGTPGGTAADAGEPGAGTLAVLPPPPAEPPTPPVGSAGDPPAQWPSESGGATAPGQPVAGEGFGATAFDFDGGCPDSGPSPDLAPDAPDPGAVATGFDGFAFPGPAEPMA